MIGQVMDTDENAVLDLSLPKKSFNGESFNSEDLLRIQHDNARANRKHAIVERNSYSPNSIDNSSNNSGSSSGSGHYVDTRRNNYSDSMSRCQQINKCPMSPEAKRRRCYFLPDGRSTLSSGSPPLGDSDGSDVEPYPSSDGLPLRYDVGCAPIQRACRGATTSLHDESLWREFAKYGTEMIINRGGRRMFPHIVLSMVGLNPEALYSVVLEIVSADERRYKFINNAWIAMGIADPGPEVQPVVHPDSPNTGAFWMHNRASFSKVRLTNNKESSCREGIDANILLLSMHKYKVVIKIRPQQPTPMDTDRTFVFDESAFVAVTAYQNSNITQLKIQNNPFAKAFRDAHHNPSLMSNSPRKREKPSRTKSSNIESSRQHRSVSHSKVPAPGLESPWSLPTLGNHPAFQQSAYNLNLLERMYRYGSTMEMDNGGVNGIPYGPWAALNRQMQAQMWLKNAAQTSPLHTLHAMSGFVQDITSMKLPVTGSLTSDYSKPMKKLPRSYNNSLGNESEESSSVGEY